MLHLHHEPDHKIFGRSLGAYGKHNQPTSGANSHRLGEMESWALKAYEAEDTLKEFLSVKSDNPYERKRFFQYAYDGNEEFYVPERLNTITNDTFKTYLKGAGINVEL
jgi:DNA-directed RNA polymerase subunit beta